MLLQICVMKKIITFITLIYLSAGTVHAQDKQQINNLTALAKVWGFLKYYHPDVAKGSPDWDKELIRMIPEIKALPDAKAFNKAITGWYFSLPKAKLAPTVTKLVSDTVVYVFDEKDIKNFGIATNLQTEFTRLYLYHLPDSNRFIGNSYQGHQLDYIYHIENPYATPDYPDEAHRLLALFRYWNIISYFYPHKKINAPGWDKVLTDFIPQFIAAANTDEYRQAFLRLTAQLKDSHSFFSQKDWSKAHNQLNLPFVTYYIDGKYFVGESRYDSLMKEQDFKVGDEIISINNKPVSDRISQLKLYTTGTNELSYYRNIGNNLFKIDTNRAMDVGISRQGRVINKAVHLFSETELYQYRKTHKLKLWENLGNGIWYVRICQVETPDTLKKLFSDLQQAKTVIWDMRDYPSFNVVRAMGPGLFANHTSSTITLNGLLLHPGAFSRKLEPAYDRSTALKLPLYTGKMIVLVNEHTQSLSESIAYDLRFRPNTIIMGRQTAGTTGNILFVDYPGGIEASFTGVGVEGLNGSFIEGKGVKIDKEVKLTAAMLTKYPDFLIETAYQEALKQGN